MAEEAVFGGVPAWLLRDYLLELGGRQAGAEVRGPGWTARLAASRDPGVLGIARVTVSIEGPSAAQAMAALRVKAQRGGG